MSRPRFLADHDLNEYILTGLLRREPAVQCLRVREYGPRVRSKSGPVKSRSSPSTSAVSTLLT
jgi:hypothetical protein